MSSSQQNPNPWPPYYTTDCSLGICSVYCPQWCYLLFPPPPPPRGHDHQTYFSPIVIGVIGVLVTAFILVCYFILISKYCRRRQGGGHDGRITTEFNDGEQWRDQTPAAPGSSSTAGLDGAVINEIPVYKYKRSSSDGLIQGTECSVCLSEFQEDESLRVLPKCCHAFHVNCIDTWFKSHSTCPICRANVVVITSV